MPGMKNKIPNQGERPESAARRILIPTPIQINGKLHIIIISANQSGSVKNLG